MFESLKKKFSRTSDKLEEELIEEAQEENNLEEESGKKFSFFSFGKKDKKEEEDSKSDIGVIPQEVESISVVSDTSDDEDSEDKNVISGFWSFGKKSGDDKKEEPPEESPEEPQEEEPKKSRFWSKNKEEDSSEVEDDDSDDETEEKKSHFWNRSNDEDSEEDEEDEPGGMFSFITAKTISEKHLEDILWELEMGLLEGDVAMEVASAVVDSVKDDLVGRKIKTSKDITENTYTALTNALPEIIDIPGKSMTEMIEAKKAQGEPLVVMFVGINGTGKTTTIGKLANYYLKKGYTPVIAAADTFRAGAIEQVNYHADNVGVKLIKHQKGSDPAAVAFDAVEHAKAQGKELVLIDTAGRMQTNTNLMDEMKKIKRVAKPDLVVFVGDALTGNDATQQASKFNEAIDIDGVILTKADADSKGGASLSIGYVIKKPILFLGMGQGYDDIREYDADWMLNQLFSESGEEVTVDEV